ncbi:MAG TPA: hypothetical protein ENN31_00480 [Candidatus Vogelbacteria bacterium]|nr:hypothetical protein [Candidatus Vogelbacteria bacterium]
MRNQTTEVREMKLVGAERQLKNLAEIFPDLKVDKALNRIKTFGQRHKGLRPLVLPNSNVNGDYQERLEEVFLRLKQKDSGFAETFSVLPGSKRLNSTSISALRRAGRLQGDDFIIIPYRLATLPPGKHCRDTGIETTGGFLHLPLLHTCWLVLAGNIEAKDDEDNRIICSCDRITAGELHRVAVLKKNGSWRVGHECPSSRFKRAHALVCRPL